MQSKPAEGDDQASVTERTERESNYEDALPWSYPLIRSPLRGQDKLSELSQVEGDLTEEQMKMINDLKVEQLKADAYLDKLIRELGIYKICNPLHRSDLKISTKIRQTFFKILLKFL